MYDIMKQTETMSEILPQTVNRMLALNAIHQQGMHLNKVILLSLLFIGNVFFIFQLPNLINL